MTLTLAPDPAAVTLSAPQPSMTLTLVGDAAFGVLTGGAAVTLSAPQPTISLTLQPDPAILSLTAPNATLAVAITPDPAVVTLGVMSGADAGGNDAGPFIYGGSREQRTSTFYPFRPTGRSEPDIRRAFEVVRRNFETLTGYSLKWTDDSSVGQKLDSIDAALAAIRKRLDDGGL